MRSITVDVNPELTVYFHKIRGEWKLGWDGIAYYNKREVVVEAIKQEHRRVASQGKKRLEDLNYLKKLFKAKGKK